MRLRRLEIERFRGIRHLDWRHIGPTAAIVGPGDTGKSTILDAIERVLSPRWNIPFDDADFWNLTTDEPIVIRATITSIPVEFYRDTKFGLALQAFDSADGVAVPATGREGEEHAVLVELRVDSSLEPAWMIRDGEENEHHVSARDRELLGMLRVGGFVDVHLNWSRGSVLTRLTESGDAVGAVLADATRQVRSSLKKEGLDRLNEAAAQVDAIGREIGVAPRSTLVPHLDVGSISVAMGALSLHDGDVPVRRAGLGTRRLLAVAMQRQAAADAGLTLVDEFEHGLEPHRIRRLLRVLRGKPPEDSGGPKGQLVLTTHSPTVVSELSPEEVVVVRQAADGSVTAACLPESIGYVMRRAPQALLAPKVVVGEGATEEGILLALDNAWTLEGDGVSFAYRGVVVVDGGGGTQPAEIAGHLASLGYTAAVILDSDTKPKPGKAAGAQMFAWSDGTSTEERIALDLPTDGLRELAHVAAHSAKGGGLRRVRECLADEMEVERRSLGDDPSQWLTGIDENRFRRALGSKAKQKGWFKSRELGEVLGGLIVRCWGDLANTPTRDLLDQLRSFVHDA